MTPDQKEHAADLIRDGEKLEAVRYLQQTLNIDAAQALLLAEKLEEEDEAELSVLRKQFDQAKQDMSQSKGVNVGRIVGLSFMTIGFIMLSLAAYFIYSSYTFSKRAIPTLGRVIDYDSYYSSDNDGGGSTMYTPIFEYSHMGSKLTYKSSVSSSSQDYDLGEEVEILVDPDDPEHVMVNNFWDRYFAVVVLGFLGSMFTGLGYMAYRLIGGKN